ncbi:MAG: hypothetical protein LBF88_07265 [Planctomycetaceae bacterium]|jgi:hypothetical protein|nr:hypothetical protein [Planctomycetaceae bacterium]
MKRVFGKTLQQMTVFISLLAYVFVLVLAPVWHVHHSNCNSQSEHTSECCLPSPVCASVEPRGECDLCRILHVTVPLFVFTAVTPEITNNWSELVVKPATLNLQTTYGIPSSRAPPLNAGS